MSLADDNPALINFNGDSPHLPSLHAGLTLTEMLDPAFEHLWLNFDASEYYSANNQAYNDTVCSDYLPFIPALSIIHESPEIPGEPLFDDPEHRRSSLRSAAPNDLADDVALPPHIAVTHSPEPSAAPLADVSAQPPQSKAASQRGPASALFSDGERSSSGSQDEWHPADPLNRPYVASTTAPSTPPVYSTLFASPRSPLLTDAQQAAYDSQSYGTPDEGLSFIAREPGAHILPAKNHFDQFNFFGSTYNFGAAVDPLCMPMIATTPIGGGPSKLRPIEQADSVQDRLYPVPSQRLSELTGFEGCESLGRYETLGEQHSALCHPHRLPERHDGRYTGAGLPAVALCQNLDAQRSSDPRQYPYDRQNTLQWSFPGSENWCNTLWQIKDHLGSYNEYVQPLQRSHASTQDWRSHYLLLEPGHLLPGSRDTSVSMSDECPPRCESLPPKRSSLAQRRTRQLAVLDTKPYSRKNLICPGMAPLRKATIFNPARPIHCTLRIERGDRTGQKCNVWCDGVAFTRHLKEGCHNFSPCKLPPSRSPGPAYAPEDDGLPMEWGFCTWDEDNDCDTFKMRRRKNRLGPMSGGDLIRHIREAHAGVPR